MTANYVLLEKITVGAAGASSVTFSSIPQTGYTDLVIKTSVRSVGTGGSGFDDYLNIRFNGDSGTNYGEVYLQGYAGSVASGGSASRNKILAGFGNGSSSTSNTFSNNEMYIPNYSGSNFKSLSIDGVLANNSSSDYVERLIAPIWRNTAAITSINLFLDGANIASGSTFYLYGVAKLGTTPAIVPYATGGDTIMTDGTYWYHAFKSSGTFTPAKGLSCDVLVVAGGGAGGLGGGGGAGGVIAFASQSLSSAQTVTVGAGGASNGANGSNSVFGSLTAAVGGGGGGAANGSNGSAGGSGGGGAYNTGGSTTGGAATSGQGNAGGTNSSIASSGFPGGGGGGAGAVGQNAVSSSQAGNGGAGTTSVTNWGALTTALTAVGMGVSNFIAGGGGAGMGNAPSAGTGGSGGGGNGGVGSATNTAGTAGTANTGSGGGGAGTASGNGGSGLVLVRYAV